MITVNDEKYILELYSRIPNSPYEYEKASKITFRGRPASKMEKNQYRIQAGVIGSSDGTYIIASNLPDELKVDDRIKFNGKIWTVSSIGYYFDSNGLVNPSIMSDKYIAARSPKGITLK